MYLCSWCGAELEVGGRSKQEKPSRATTILAAILRNFLISLTVYLYIYYGAEKAMKTVTDAAAPDQAVAAPTPLRLLDQVRARIRVLH